MRQRIADKLSMTIVPQMRPRVRESFWRACRWPVAGGSRLPSFGLRRSIAIGRREASSARALPFGSFGSLLCTARGRGNLTRGGKLAV